MCSSEKNTLVNGCREWAEISAEAMVYQRGCVAWNIQRHGGPARGEGRGARIGWTTAASGSLSFSRSCAPALALWVSRTAQIRPIHYSPSLLLHVHNALFRAACKSKRKTDCTGLPLIHAMNAGSTTYGKARLVRALLQKEFQGLTRPGKCRLLALNGQSRISRARVSLLTRPCLSADTGSIAASEEPVSSQGRAMERTLEGEKYTKE